MRCRSAEPYLDLKVLKNLPFFRVPDYEFAIEVLKKVVYWGLR